MLLGILGQPYDSEMGSDWSIDVFGDIKVLLLVTEQNKMQVLTQSDHWVEDQLSFSDLRIEARGWCWRSNTWMGTVRHLLVEYLSLGFNQSLAKLLTQDHIIGVKIRQRAGDWGFLNCCYDVEHVVEIGQVIQDLVIDDYQSVLLALQDINENRVDLFNKSWRVSVQVGLRLHNADFGRWSDFHQVTLDF